MKQTVHQCCIRLTCAFRSVCLENAHCQFRSCKSLESIIFIWLSINLQCLNCYTGDTGFFTGDLEVGWHWKRRSKNTTCPISAGKACPTPQHKPDLLTGYKNKYKYAYLKTTASTTLFLLLSYFSDTFMEVTILGQVAETEIQKIMISIHC